jgi:hypothetical protein
MGRDRVGQNTQRDDNRHSPRVDRQGFGGVPER